MSIDELRAKEYMTRLLAVIAPQCEPLSDCVGLATQLDNFIAGQAERVAVVEAALAECEADNEGLRHDAERYHLMCNTLWEKVTATGDEDCARIAVNRIIELEGKLAECERKLAVVTKAAQAILDDEMSDCRKSLAEKLQAALTEAGEGEK